MNRIRLYGSPLAALMNDGAKKLRLSNDELRQAIDQAHFLCQHTAPSSGLEGVKKHRDELLAIQRKRAAEEDA